VKVSNGKGLANHTGPESCAAGSETPSMLGNTSYGNRESLTAPKAIEMGILTTSGSPRTHADDDRCRQAVGWWPSTAEVPEQTAGEEGTEGRPPAKGNAPAHSFLRTQSRNRDYRMRGSIREQARMKPSSFAIVGLTLLPKARAGCGNSARPDL
jgi:hypothetical protein